MKAIVILVVLETEEKVVGHWVKEQVQEKGKGTVWVVKWAVVRVLGKHLVEEKELLEFLEGKKVKEVGL
jgi:F0F1-type ATP synthase alpha subunit